MENLKIEKFDPIRAEVCALVESVKNVVVSLPSGNMGYELMKENKSALQKKRTEISKLFKDERAGALAYQKAIISAEKDILLLIEPVENDLKEKIQKIDEANERAKRVELLPDRMNMLKEIDVEADPDSLLSMDDMAFSNFYNQKKGEYLEEKERKMKEAEEQREAERMAKVKEEEDARMAKVKKENDRIQAENDKIMAEKRAIQEANEKIEADKKKLEDEKLEAEKAKQRDLELEAAKKKAAEDEVKRIEDERLAAEERIRQEKRDLEKQESYQQFLAVNNYTPKDKLDLIVEKNATTTILYREIARITI